MKKTILNPLLALAGCFAAFNGTSTLQAQTTNIWNFNYTGSIVDWTAPSTGYYHITAYGAQGGGDLWWKNSAGLGAIMGGVFQLQAGSVLKLLVGEQGSFTNVEMGGGGGGGSFVVGSNNTPLVVSGSGAGVAFGFVYSPGPYGQYTDQSYFSPNANTNTSGGSVGFSHDTSTNVIMTYGGINGNGGNITTSGYGSGDNQGAGGGGFYGDGSSVTSGRTTWASGGQSYTSGGAGGSGGKTQDTAGTPNNGGFGGGGQGNSYGSGGGGGYSGGAGGPQVASEGDNPSFAGGGGSFLASNALRPTMTLGNTGNGQIVIATLSDLIVGDNASNQSTNFTSGTNAYNSIFVGSAPGDTNNGITVTSSGTVLYSYNNIIVGENGSANDLYVSGGGRVNSSAAGVIGLNAGANGNYVAVTGITTHWSNGTSLTIGQSGSSNSLAIQEGGLVTAGGAGGALGYNAGSSGNSLLVDGAGSTLANSSDFVVGFSGSSNTVVVSGGGILTNGQHSYGGIIGLSSGASNNSVLVTGSGSAWNNGGDLLVGWGDSGNTLTVSNGGAVTSRQVNYGGAIGFNAGSSNNNVMLTGNGSSWSNSGDLLVGVSGSGNSMVITNGGTVANGQVNYGGVIGFNAGSSNNSVVVTESGSTWSNSGDLLVGVSGSGNSMVISNGAMVANGQVNYGGVIGLNSNSTGNSVLVTGSGSTWNNSSNLIVGYDGSGNSLAIESGGKVTTDASYAPWGVSVGAILGFNAGSSNNSVLVTGSGSSLYNYSPATLTIGNSGSGNSMVVSNGGHVSAAYSYIGYNAGSSNNSVLVTGSGSLLSTTSNIFIGNSGSGNSLVISNGGKVTSFIAEIGYNAGSSNNSVLVTGSGSSLSNNSYYGTIIGNGGGGTLTVANGGVAASTEPQGITVASQAGSVGTLNIGGFGTNDAAGTINAPKITFGAGTGTINFNQSNATTISADISGNGTVNQLGSGTTTLTGNNSYTGATTVASGTLLVDGEISLSDVSVLHGAGIGGSGTLGGSLSLAAGAQFVFSLTGALTVDGVSVTFGDFGIDDLVGLDSTVANGAYTLIDGTALINFSNVANLGAQNAVGIGGGKLAYFSEGSLVVNVIPEPSTYALLALAAAGLGGYMLRHRRK